MFWNRKKRVQVEITNFNKNSFKMSELGAQPRIDGNADSVKVTDADYVFKFITGMVLLTQAALIIWGYLDLAVYYEGFGIQISELDIGIPTFLAFGYIYSFGAIMGSADSTSAVGSFFPTLVFLGLGVLVTFLYYEVREARKSGAIIPWWLRGVYIGAVLMLIYSAPLLSVGSGLSRMKDDFLDYTKKEAKFGLSKEHTIVTDGSALTGHIVVADLRSTFLLVDQVLYKIDNSSNRVMRKTELTPKEKPSAENHPSKPD